jgi:hypothetical protein
MSAGPALGLLRALCAGLSPTGIEVVADDSRTAFMPARNRIMVARRFLAADTPVAIGALMHEVGHALVTRYDRFAEPAGAPTALWRQALNAVEESRVHRFLRERLPGVRRYLEALFAMDTVPEADEFESDLVVFLAATATWDRYPSLPFIDAFPSAAAAFRETMPARMRYTQALPPANMVARPDVAIRYERDVVPALRAGGTASVAPLEAEILCAAAAALRIFVAEIWPVILKLAERDQSRIARALAENPALHAAAESTIDGSTGAALARQALRAVWADECGPLGGAGQEGIAKLAALLLRHYLDASTSPQHGATSGPKRSGFAPPADATDDPEDIDDDDEPEEAPEDHGETMPHDQMASDHAALVAVLRQAVPPRPVRWSSGYRSGTVLDLDRVMRASATGRDADRIWARRRAEHPALAALLLVDLSGSMRGEKVEAAIGATRALSAALAQIRGVSWCVRGFQDRTIPVVDFNERGEALAAARIEAMRAEVAGTRPGGNNQPGYNDDGPCLLDAATELLARPERDRLLMVISDGSPEGRHSGRKELHRAVATVRAMPGMTLVGLGLGPGTEHVTNYYPTARANVALDELAPVIGQLLASGLRTAAG